MKPGASLISAGSRSALNQHLYLNASGAAGPPHVKPLQGTGATCAPHAAAQVSAAYVVVSAMVVPP
jgi:hypothetical protein